MTDHTLLLVDGSSYLFRAYHAMPNLTNDKKEPTGALYGVLRMLEKIKKSLGTSHALCVFDAKGPTFRHDMYAEYKANRSAMPEALAQQIAPLKEAIVANGWPLLAIPGIEADDAIGALAKQAAHAGFKVIISTGDKDMAQLVDDNIQLVNTMTDEWLDRAGVQAKWGVPPERIVDWLMLVGDSSDNIPGVNKVGAKTATKWLQQWSSIDQLIENKQQLKGAVGQYFADAIAQFELTRALLTIRCDQPRDFDLDTLRWQAVDYAQLTTIYTHNNFSQLLDDIAQATGEGTPPTVNGQPSANDYQLITTVDALEHWLTLITEAPITAVDTETTSLNVFDAELVGISLAVAPGQAAYIPFGHTYIDRPEQLAANTVLTVLKPWLEAPDQAKVGHHMNYDQHVLANYDIRLAGVCADTLLASYVLSTTSKHDLDSLARQFLGVQPTSYQSLCGSGVKQISFAEVPLDAACQYACEDADYTFQLNTLLSKKLSQDSALQRLYLELDLPLRDVLYTTERNGILLDDRVLIEQSKSYEVQLLALESQAHDLAGHTFNLNSPKQVAEVLFVEQKLPIVKKTSGGTPSTDEASLQQLALDYPIVKTILRHRTLAKLKSTYTDKLPRMINAHTGRIHTKFSQTVTSTGRLASSDPNLQNIPIRTEEGRQIRAAFVAPTDYVLLSADYSQIELRIMAHLSQDETMSAAFQANQDIHQRTAAEIFNCDLAHVSAESRRVAKAINFGLIYGMSAFGLAKRLHVDRNTAQSYINYYFARYPGVKDYMHHINQQARQTGYVTTMLGRRIDINGIDSASHRSRQMAERFAINAPIQGSAADLIKQAMLDVDQWLRHDNMPAKMVLQVHDELVLEVHQDVLHEVSERLAHLMTNVVDLSIPLTVNLGHGHNWGDAH